MTKPDWKKIRKEYESSKITMKDLAEKHGVKASTLRSRKSRENWQQDATQQPEKKVATKRNKKKSVATQKAIEELNNNDDLTEKQKQFCLLYLKYFNATKAYKESYEVDYKTANVAGPRLLVNVSIQEELERLKKAQRKELYVDSLDIKREWLKQAFTDVSDFLEFGNEEYIHTDDLGRQETRIRSFVRLKNADEVDGTLIQEVKQGREGVSLKLYDKQKALEKIEQFLAVEEEASAEDTIIFMTDTSEMEKWVEENGGL